MRLSILSKINNIAPTNNAPTIRPLSILSKINMRSGREFPTCYKEVFQFYPRSTVKLDEKYMDKTLDFQFYPRSTLALTREKVEIWSLSILSKINVINDTVLISLRTKTFNSIQDQHVLPLSRFHIRKALDFQFYPRSTMEKALNTRVDNSLIFQFYPRSTIQRQSWS